MKNDRQVEKTRTNLAVAGVYDKIGKSMARSEPGTRARKYRRRQKKRLVRARRRFDEQIVVVGWEET